MLYLFCVKQVTSIIADNNVSIEIRLDVTNPTGHNMSLHSLRLSIYYHYWKQLMSRHAIIDRLRLGKPIIAPSMLKCDFGNLHREVELLEAANVDVLHLDVMDGNFVPNLSYGAMVIERMRELTGMIFDAHLMISDPDKYLDDFIKAGCDAITFHIEAVPDPLPLLSRIKEAGVVAGLAINPGTTVDQIKRFVPECDLILVMSVEPGFGGQEFMPVAIEKLQQLRAIGGDQLILSVDGGIAPETIQQVAAAAAGANLFVAGSAIFNHEDYQKAIQEMSQLAQSAIPVV